MATAEHLDIVKRIRRPDSSLLTYYFILSLLAGPFFPLVLTPLFFRYRTLRYELDDEGVSMRWGMLFHREISLTYTRIQDIHLQSNAVERYLGLARVQVQTASGASKAEMTIEGIKQFASVRDFLYSRMRGVRGASQTPSTSEPAAGQEALDTSSLAETLRAVAAELAALRADLAKRDGSL